MGVRINIAEIVPVAGTRTSRALRRALLLVQADWRQRARRTLRGTRTAYIDAIRIAPGDDTRGQVVLHGTVPNIVEQGMGAGGVGTEGPYDIRTFLLKEGTRSLRGREGSYYVNVPFQHTLGSAMALADAGGGDAEHVADRMRALEPTTSSGGRTNWGGPGSRLQWGLMPKLQPHHATDPLHGMVKLVSSYAAASASRQPTFRTWRRISQRGKPWISRVKARNIAAEVVQNMPQILDKVLNA